MWNGASGLLLQGFRFVDQHYGYAVPDVVNELACLADQNLVRGSPVVQFTLALRTCQDLEKSVVEHVGLLF